MADPGQTCIDSAPKDPAAHDGWFRAKVREALDDLRPAVPHEEVEARMSQKRAQAL